MKRILLLLTVLLLCLSLCSCDSLLQKVKTAVTGNEPSVMPEDYVTTLENDKFKYELYETYVKVIEYLAEETEVSIPSEIDGKPVTAIGSYCFFETAKVTSVSIPDSVTVIEQGAFYYADSLISITIPDTVTSIGSRAFAWCNSLESITISKSIAEIPDYCFNHCVSLTAVDIPENVKKIGVRAFSYCEKLVDQTIPDSVESIGERAFVGCSELEFLTIENSALSFGNNVFEETLDVIIIADESSTSYDYCSEYGLRWSTSKTIEAVKLGSTDGSVAESAESAE